MKALRNLLIGAAVFILLTGCMTSGPGRYSDVPVMDGAMHTVREGETPIAIARTYEISLPLLQRVNNIRANTPLKPGAQLFIPGATELRSVKVELAAEVKPDGLYHTVDQERP